MHSNIKDIKQFISNIFQDLTFDEHVIFWGSSKQNPGFPKSHDAFFNHLERSGKQLACYFSTSTVTSDVNNCLYNRQKLFKRMFCIVLDDIGTGAGSKCKDSALPDLLKNNYSWRLETSPDNFQYGYLLDKPIEDLNMAKEFVKIIYGAGPWDSGGAMPNKLVRLPCGVNLKQKYAKHDELWMINQGAADKKRDFKFKYSPDELLTAVNAGVTWADIKDGTANRLDPRHTQGTTAWRDGVFQSNLHGVVDDVLEWLNGKELIVNENNDWVDIICPWGKEHSDGINTAGYKPLGYGDLPERRLFHCFHDHCKNNRTREFLNWVKHSKGPIVPMVDPVPALVSQWAFDQVSNEFILINSCIPRRIPNAGFRTGHQEDVFWEGLNDKPIKATQYGLIVKNPGLLKLFGSKYAPGGPYIIEDGKEKFLNSWHIPDWAIQKPVDPDKDWKIFTDFLHYLMPENNDADWFLNHLASKVQIPTYRGPGVLLTTPVFGSGRGTLCDMISRLWGSYNLTNVSLGSFLKGLNTDGFTAWLQSLWLIIPETSESTMNRRQEARIYEALKTGVDPRPTSHMIKNKYGSEAPDTVFSSLIACSNHQGQMNVPLNDRRFKFINCAIEVATQEYFTALNKWFDGSWEASIWHKLMAWDISKYDGFSPQNLQRGTDHENDHLMNLLAGQSPIDRLVTITILFANKYCEGVFCTKILCTWIHRWKDQLGLATIHNWEDIYKRQLQNATTELKYKNKRQAVRIEGEKCFTRHTLNTEGYKIKNYIGKTGDFEKVKNLIMNQNDETFKDFSFDIFNEAGL